MQVFHFLNVITCYVFRAVSSDANFNQKIVKRSLKYPKHAKRNLHKHTDPCARLGPIETLARESDRARAQVQFPESENIWI